MKLITIEKIEDKLTEIQRALREDDAYYVRDTIITNFDDPEMPDLVHEMLVNYGYEEDKIAEVMEILKEIIEVLEEPEEQE